MSKGILETNTRRSKEMIQVRPVCRSKDFMVQPGGARLAPDLSPAPPFVRRFLSRGDLQELCHRKISIISKNYQHTNDKTLENLLYLRTFLSRHNSEQ